MVNSDIIGRPDKDLWDRRILKATCGEPEMIFGQQGSQAALPSRITLEIRKMGTKCGIRFKLKRMKGLPAPFLGREGHF